MGITQAAVDHTALGMRTFNEQFMTNESSRFHRSFGPQGLDRICHSRLQHLIADRRQRDEKETE